jgi:hypothetical protein
LKNQYLIFYNLVSAILWFAVLARVILLVPLVGFPNVYGGLGEFTKWTQTAAFVEILHSALGEWLSISVPADGMKESRTKDYALMADVGGQELFVLHFPQPSYRSRRDSCSYGAL